MTNTEDLTCGKEFEEMQKTFGTPPFVGIIPNFQGKEAKVYGFSSILNNLQSVAVFFKLHYDVTTKNNTKLHLVEYIYLDHMIFYDVIFYDEFFETVYNFKKQSICNPTYFSYDYDNALVSPYTLS